MGGVQSPGWRGQRLASRCKLLLLLVHAGELDAERRSALHVADCCLWHVFRRLLLLLLVLLLLLMLRVLLLVVKMRLMLLLQLLMMLLLLLLMLMWRWRWEGHNAGQGRQASEHKGRHLWRLGLEAIWLCSCSLHHVHYPCVHGPDRMTTRRITMFWNAA